MMPRKFMRSSRRRTPKLPDDTACNYDADSESSTVVYTRRRDTTVKVSVSLMRTETVFVIRLKSLAVLMTACNHVASPTDLVVCTYPEVGYDCSGQCIQDDDEDGVCNEFEIEGCTDINACNLR